VETSSAARRDDRTTTVSEETAHADVKVVTYLLLELLALDGVDNFGTTENEGEFLLSFEDRDWLVSVREASA
jgi:hypothetical protein